MAEHPCPYIASGGPTALDSIECPSVWLCQSLGCQLMRKHETSTSVHHHYPPSRDRTAPPDPRIMRG